MTFKEAPLHLTEKQSEAAQANRGESWMARGLVKVLRLRRAAEGGASDMGIHVTAPAKVSVRQCAQNGRVEELPLSRVRNDGRDKILKAPADLSNGDTLCVRGIDFSRSRRTLVIATASDCGFCTSGVSLEFFGQLSSRAESLSIPAWILVGGPKVTDLERQYRLLFGAQVIHLALPSVGIVRAPSVYVVDQHGVIVSTQVGEPGSKETEKVVASILREDPRLSWRPGVLSETEFERQRRVDPTLQVVDIRDEGERPDVDRFPGAHEIPSGELSLRAKYELDQQRILIFDCRPVGGLRCQEALYLARKLGFAEINAVGFSPAGASKSCSK